MSVDDCPDCRKLQSECEALERELAGTREDLDHMARLYLRLAIRPDPRAPKPVYVPAAVPPAQRRRRFVHAHCPVCDREHDCES